MLFFPQKRGCVFFHRCPFDRSVWLETHGFHWFRWVAYHLPEPSISPKGRLWSSWFPFKITPTRVTGLKKRRPAACAKHSLFNWNLFSGVRQSFEGTTSCLPIRWTDRTDIANGRFPCRELGSVNCGASSKTITCAAR